MLRSIANLPVKTLSDRIISFVDQLTDMSAKAKLLQMGSESMRVPIRD